MPTLVYLCIFENLEWPYYSSRQGQGHMRRLRQKAAEEIVARRPELLYDVWIQMNHPRHKFNLPDNSKYVADKWVCVQFLSWLISQMGGGAPIPRGYQPMILSICAENCMKTKTSWPPDEGGGGGVGGGHAGCFSECKNNFCTFYVL